MPKRIGEITGAILLPAGQYCSILSLVGDGLRRTFGPGTDLVEGHGPNPQILRIFLENPGGPNTVVLGSYLGMAYPFITMKGYIHSELKEHG